MRAPRPAPGPTILGVVKEFWVYTAMRLGLFVGAFGIIFGIWFLIAGEVNIFWTMLLAFLVSGVLSFSLLDRQRDALAANVQRRAHRVSAKYEEYKAKEDTD